jgi:hypothetical protein
MNEKRAKLLPVVSKKKIDHRITWATISKSLRDRPLLKTKW